MHIGQADRSMQNLWTQVTHFDITFRSQLYNTISDPIRLYREDEVYRSHIYYDGPYSTVFAIWRLR